MTPREEHLSRAEHRCSFCQHELANPAFGYDVWDKLRFGHPIEVTEEQWAEEARSHEADCPWVKARGDCFWSA